MQTAYNEDHNITPTSIQKDIDHILSSTYEADYVTVPSLAEKSAEYMTPDLILEIIKDLRVKMRDAAQKLEFEEAARIRDDIKALQEMELDVRA